MLACALQVGFILKVDGSVFPKALKWAAPCTLINIGLSFLFHHFHGDEVPSAESMSTLVSLFAAMTSVLGFLIVFRTRTAYGRYWEGITFFEVLFLYTLLTLFTHSQKV